MRRAKHRIPAQPTEVPVAMVLPDGALHRKSRAAQSRAGQGQQERSRELKFNGAFHEVVSMWGGHCCSPRPLSPTVTARVAVILSLAVKRSNPILRPRHYLRTQNIRPPDYRRRGYRGLPAPAAGHDDKLIWATKGPFPGKHEGQLMSQASYDLAGLG